MSKKNYKIDPVKATCLKYGKNYKGIQGLNDTCFGICAAFSGTYDTYNMDPNCSKSCEDLIEMRKHEIYGVGSCDHQVPYRPVYWEQIPRYVPMLLKNGKTPKQAKQMCEKLCLNSNLKIECLENCNLDFNAIIEEKIETIKPQSKKVETNFTNLKQEKRKHPTLFWVILSIIIFIFLFILIFIIKMYI